MSIFSIGPTKLEPYVMRAISRVEVEEAQADVALKKSRGRGNTKAGRSIRLSGAGQFCSARAQRGE